MESQQKPRRSVPSRSENEDGALKALILLREPGNDLYLLQSHEEHMQLEKGRCLKFSETSCTSIRVQREKAQKAFTLISENILERKFCETTWRGKIERELKL